MRRSLILTMFFLASCGEPSVVRQSSLTVPTEKKADAQAPVTESGTDDEENPLPQISVELAKTHSPEDLISILPHLDLCEAGRDGFYDSYANVLGPETDRCFPVATKIRPRLLGAFESIREMELFSSGLVGNHQGARLPGYVEHVLHLCFQHDLAREPKDDCSLEAVERTLTEMDKQFDPHEWGDDVESQLANFKQARSRFLLALKDVQSDLDEQGGKYLRSELITNMRQWIKLNLELK